MNSRGHWTVVREVISSTTTGVDVMSALPGLVERLINEDAWREFDAPPPIGHIKHPSFRAFVEAKPAGLGSRLDQLKALCGSRQDLADLVQRLYDGEIGPAAQHGGDHRSESFQDCDTSLKVKPDRRDHVIARLKRDDPALAKRVIDGEITANAAAHQKGWRKPRVVLSSPKSIARALRRHLDPDDLAALARLLTDNT